MDIIYRIKNMEIISLEHLMCMKKIIFELCDEFLTVLVIGSLELNKST